MDQAAHVTLRDLLLLVRQKKVNVETLIGLLREVFEGITGVEEAEHEFWKSVCGKAA